MCTLFTWMARLYKSLKGNKVIRLEKSQCLLWFTLILVHYNLPLLLCNIITWQHDTYKTDGAIFHQLFIFIKIWNFLLVSCSQKKKIGLPDKRFVWVTSSLSVNASAASYDRPLLISSVIIATLKLVPVKRVDVLFRFFILYLVEWRLISFW